MIPRETLFGNPERTSPQLSPEGTRLAYLAPDAGVLNVWVRTLGADDDRAVTRDRARGIQFFTWQLDGRHVLYIQDCEGDENWRLFQTALESRETRDLTPHEGAQAQLVAYEPAYPDELLVGLNVRDARLHDVYRLNLESGELTLEVENPGDVSQWVADHGLRVRAATSMTAEGGTVIRVRETVRSEWCALMEWGPDESFGGVRGFSPDNRKLWVISSLEANAARLLEVDLVGGGFCSLAADPIFDVGGVMSHPTRHHLEAVRFVRARREWQLLDETLTADFEALRSVNDGDFQIVSRDLADLTWVVSFIRDDRPLEYCVFDRGSRRAEFLFSNRPRLEQYSLAPMRPFSFRSRDGLTVHGYLTLPDGDGPFPLVVNVHGGPWHRDVWGLDNEVQWLANRGYAVLQVNFRGSTGYGKEFLNAGDREWAAGMHDDLVDGKNWAIEQGYADPERIAIYGGSYGGYAALVGLTFTPEEFTCAVDVVGPSNLVTLIRSIPPYWLPMKSIFDKRVGDVDSEEEFLKSRSPLFRCERIRRPLLIAQGANDPRVKKAESDQIVEAMRKKGLEVEYVVFPDEGHGFVRPENRIRFYAATEQFLAAHLGGRAEPPSESERWEDLRK